MKDARLDSKDHCAIFLIGFMGSGKTMTGRALARMLEFQFLDLDELIETRAGRTVREIFSESGEARFRELEREALELCCGQRRTVVALGGGAYVSEENRSLVTRAGIAVWLDCPLDLCFERAAGDPSRPLAANESEFRSLYVRRRETYARADLVVRTGARSPEEIAAEIVEMLKAVT